MNRDELKGKAEAFKGKMKKNIGDLANDPAMRDEGEAQEIRGKTQDAFGRGRRKVGEAIEDVGKAVKR